MLQCWVYGIIVADPGKAESHQLGWDARHKFTQGLCMDSGETVVLLKSLTFSSEDVASRGPAMRNPLVDCISD